jgi:hypothetical protein
MAGRGQDAPFLPLLWEAERPGLLPTPYGEGRALALANLDGRVIVGGSISGADRRQVAGYWDQGSFKELPVPSSTIESELSDLQVADGGMYGVGYRLPAGDGSRPEALLWEKSQKPVILKQPAGADADAFEYPRQLRLDGTGAISILGSSRTVWRSAGQLRPQTLDMDDSPYRASLLASMAISPDRVWIVGTSYDDSQESGPSRAVLWDESGILLHLDQGSFFSGGALDLYVQGQD